MTTPKTGSETEATEEQSYYGEVESYFVGRRGSPLFITPAEWDLIAKWEEAGVPLHVIREGIDRVFDRPQTSRRPRKLGYCRQTVEATFRRFREVMLGSRGSSEPGNDAGEDGPAGVAAYLARLASELATVAPEAAARVEALEALLPDLHAVEEALAQMDGELLDEAEGRLAEAARDALHRQAAASLADYRERMPEKVYQSALRSAYRRRLRRHAKIPRLSLLDR